ncbi:MAG: hypothetical protein ACI971_001608 [Colwellia sp.]|jgi:hypothetical protein
MSVKTLLIFIYSAISTLVFDSDHELDKLSEQLKKTGVNVPSNKALNKSIHIQENGESCLLALKHKGWVLKETINKNMNIKALFNVLSVQRNRSLCFESQLINWSKEYYEADRLLGNCILNHDDWKTFNINKATDLKTVDEMCSALLITQNQDDIKIILDNEQKKLNISEKKKAKEKAEFAVAKKNALADTAVSKQALGAMYFIGRGTPKNCDIAHNLFIKAAKQGNANAQYALGQLYELGCESIEKNVKQAFNWFYVCMSDDEIKSDCSLMAKSVAQDNPSLGPELSQWNTRGIDFIQDFYGAEAYQVRVAENKAYSKKKAQQKIKVKSLALSKVEAFKVAVSAVAVNCSNYSQYMKSTLTRQVRRLAGAAYLESVGGDSSAHYQIIINQLSLDKGGPLPLLQQQGCFKAL